MSEKNYAKLFCFSVCLSVFFPPYHMLATRLTILLSDIFYVLPFLLVLLDFKRWERKDIKNAIGFGALWTTIWCASMLFNGDMPVAGVVLFAIFGTAFLTVNNKIRKLSFYYFTKLFALFLLLGIIEFLLYLKGYYIPLGLTERSTTQGKYTLIQGIFNFFSLYSKTMFRFQSMAEEPGLIGTLCALMVFAIDRKVFKKEFYVFIVSGIFTFSMAFFILISLYFATQLRNIRTWVYIALALGALWEVYDTYKDTPTVKHYVTKRFEKGKAADRRVTKEFDTYLQQKFIPSKKVFIGEGVKVMYRKKNILNRTGGNAGVKVMFLQIGLAGIGLLMWFYTKTMFNNKGYSVMSLLFVLVFWLSFYQREYIIYPYMVMLAFSPLLLNKALSDE